jgi:CHAD domain-containing protein
LRACAVGVGEWDLGGAEMEPLLQSLRLAYRGAKRRGRLAWSTGDADDLHALRVRVVDLSHQCALFEPAWPALLTAYGAELQKLRQSLGAHNDLTVLGEFALSRRELSGEAAEALVALVLRKRKPLERKAALQFERLFAERPGAFERRMAAYLSHPQQRGAKEE